MATGCSCPPAVIVLDLRGQPGRHAAGVTLVERRVHLLPGVLARRQLEVPALVVAADPPPQRDLVLDEVAGPRCRSRWRSGRSVWVRPPGWPPSSGRLPSFGRTKSASASYFCSVSRWSPLLLVTPPRLVVVDREAGGGPLDHQRAAGLGCSAPGQVGRGPRVGVHVQPGRVGLARLVPGLDERGQVGGQRGAVRAEPGYLEGGLAGPAGPPRAGGCSRRSNGDAAGVGDRRPCWRRAGQRNGARASRPGAPSAGRSSVTAHDRRSWVPSHRPKPPEPAASWR